MSDELQPIIIKRKKGGHAGGHGGSWKVAFADFMTAMMCFFLVMWLVNQSDDVKQAVGGYFRDPGKFKAGGGTGVLKGSQSVIPLKKTTVENKRSTSEKSGFGPSDEEKKELSLAAKNILKELQKQTAFQRLKKNV